MIYKISKQAEKDIENIWLYTLQTWSLEQADYYVRLVLDEIKYISENPKSGEDFSHLRKGYFKTKVKSHPIFFTISKDSQTITIVRILHERMDISSKISNK
jgi:toxin ParE1/3/4